MEKMKFLSGKCNSRLLSLLSCLSIAPYLLLIINTSSIRMATAVPSLKIAGPQKDVQKEIDTRSAAVGQSPGYQKAASTILSSINQSADPCDNFFEFACGRWVSENQIPEDQSSYGHFHELVAKVELEMKGLFESKEKSPSRAINDIRQLYAQCMDEERLAQLRGTELVNAIQQMGYWPIVHGEKWHANKYDLTNLLIHTSLTRAMEIILNIYVSQDQRNVSRRLIHLDQGGLGLGGGSKGYFMNMDKYKKQIDAYKQYMINKIKLVAEDAGETKTEQEIAGGVEEMIDLEKSIAEIMTAKDDRRDYSRMYNPYKLSDLEKLFPLVDWDKYFKAVMPAELHEYMSTNPDVIVNEVDYLKKLTDLLKSVDSRILTNYIVWRYTSGWSMQLDSRYDDVQQDFLRVFIGKQVKSPRWKDCIAVVSSRISYAASALYARQYFNTKDKEVALDMIKDLHDAFRDMVSHNDWMDEQTKKIAIEKSKAMQSLIGYPDFVLNDEKLDDFYKLLNLESGDTLATMVEKTIKWKQDYSLRQLIEPVDRTEFDISSSTVNAFYTPLRNSIIFPAAILQAPLFDRSFPKMVNYGRMGTVIGHEITHGFDDGGSQFDKVGNLLNWWDQATKEHFNERKTCIVEQYNKFSLPGTDSHVNGRLTQGENIADNGGIKEAYKAYKNYVQKLGHEEERLPGLEQYDNDQIFFISFAQTWCSKYKPEAAIRQILTDPHAPPQFRVDGVAVNQPGFAQAFQCTPGSAMNPTQKCVVW